MPPKTDLPEFGPGGGFPHTGRPGFCLASLCVFSRASCYLDKRCTVFGFKSEIIQPCFQLCPLPKELYIEPGNKILANHEMPIHGHEWYMKELARTHAPTHARTQSCTCRLKDASFHFVFYSSAQQPRSKGPELFIITKAAWGPRVTRETWWSDVWNMRRPLWTSRLASKWCKQTPSITECINLLRVKGARNFISLGLLPYLIRQHPASSSPTCLFSAPAPGGRHCWRLSKPQWLLLALVCAGELQPRPPTPSQILLSQTDSRSHSDCHPTSGLPFNTKFWKQ